MAKKSAEQILLEKAIITKEQYDKAMEESRKKGMSMGRVIVRSGMITEEVYAQALSEGGYPVYSSRSIGPVMNCETLATGV